MYKRDKKRHSAIITKNMLANILKLFLCGYIYACIFIFCHLIALKMSFIHHKVLYRNINFSWLFATPWTAARQASQSFAISQSLLKFTSIESVISLNGISYIDLSYIFRLFPLLIIISKGKIFIPLFIQLFQNSP